MTPEQSQHVFLERLQGAGLDLVSLRPAEGIAAMLEFYAAERAEGCPLDQDADMLLFQYGTDGGKSFDFNITRQFMTEDGEDDGIWQLGLTFQFAAAAMLDALGSETEWCDTPDSLPEFRELIERSAAYQEIGQSTDGKVSLNYDNAG